MELLIYTTSYEVTWGLLVEIRNCQELINFKKTGKESQNNDLLTKFTILIHFEYFLLALIKISLPVPAALGIRPTLDMSIGIFLPPLSLYGPMYKTDKIAGMAITNVVYICQFAVSS